MYNMRQTKQKRQVKKRGKLSKQTSKVARLQEPEARWRPRGLPEELASMFRPVKKPVTLRLDADILAWFQRGGRGYQTRINQALRKVMTGERKGGR